MRYQSNITMLITAIGLSLAMASQASAAAEVLNGIVVSATSGKLVMTDRDTKTQSQFTIGKDTPVIVYGKAGKLEDLLKGDRIRVTRDRNKERVMQIETVDAK